METTEEKTHELLSTVEWVIQFIGNVDHSIGNGPNAAKLRGDKLNDIREVLKEARENFKR